MQIKTNIIDVIKSWCIDKSNLITSWAQTASDENVPSEKLVKDELDKKDTITNVDTKINNAKTELNTEIGKKIDKTNIKTSITNSLTNDDVVGGKAIYDKILAVESEIPDGITHSDITDWATATSNFEDKTNKTTSVSESPSDVKYPTEKAVKTALDDAKTAADDTYAAKAHEHTHSDVSDWATATSGFEVSENKATSLTSPDNTKYPTTKAVSDEIATVKTNADNTYATKTELTSGLAEKIDVSSKTTELTSSSADAQVPSAKAVYDLYNTIPKWNVQMAESVSALPATGQLGTIYLVKNSGSGNSGYDEYFWNNTSDTPSYEKFGGVDIDISDLVTMPEVLDYISNNGSMNLSEDGTLSLTIN